MSRSRFSVACRSELLFVGTRLVGPRGGMEVDLVLDTGAAATTLTPKIAAMLGYRPADGYKASSVTTALGVEHGYWLRVAELTALGISTPFALTVAPLGHLDIHGLLGMNFLRHFNFEIRPREQVILAELIQA